MKFFLLAAGIGRRAQPLSLFKPKPLFPLAGQPLLKLMLSQLRRQGVAEGFVNVHHLGEKITAACAGFPGITFFPEKQLSGSMALKRALPQLDDLLLAINGDVYLEIPLAALLEKMTRQRADGVLLARHEPQRHYAHLMIEGDDFHGIEKSAPGPGWFYTGVALFQKNVVAAINERNFFESLAKNRFRIKVVSYQGVWLDLGTPGRYFFANFEYQKQLGDPGGSSLSENVSLSADSILERTIVWENTRIGNGSILSDCIVTGDLELSGVRFSRRIITPGNDFPLR